MSIRDYPPPSYAESVRNQQGHVRDDGWNSSQCMSKSQVICLTIGIALTVIAATAAVLCLVYGLGMFDTAWTTLETFGSGFLIYSGLAFAVVAVGNALYTGYKFVCRRENTEFEYKPKHAKIQIAASIFAPVAAIPVVIFFALSMAINKQQYRRF